ncbi:unnamed protein product [Boreogadus saida]
MEAEYYVLSDAHRRSQVTQWREIISTRDVAELSDGCRAFCQCLSNESITELPLMEHGFPVTQEQRNQEETEKQRRDCRGTDVRD